MRPMPKMFDLTQLSNSHEVHKSKSNHNQVYNHRIY